MPMDQTFNDFAPVPFPGTPFGYAGGIPESGPVNRLQFPFTVSLSADRRGKGIKTISIKLKYFI